MSMNKETPAALEAILFASGSPVSFDRLCELLYVDRQGLSEAADVLKEHYSDDTLSGISLIIVDDAYQLCTKPFVADYVKRALELRKAPPLSKASLEVLAIIAYNQPVTRSFIEMVRGVDSSFIVSSLCEKGLIAERGVLDAPGRPILFGTTDVFLRCFGLESLDDLPKTEIPVDGSQISLDIDKEDENSLQTDENAAPKEEGADDNKESADKEKSIMTEETQNGETV